MTRQSKVTYLGRASIQHMEQNSFALFHANGLAVVQHPAIDRKRTVADFVSVRHALGEGSLHGRLALSFEHLHLGWRQELLGHVSTPAESWLELLKHKEDFAVVVAWLVLWLDVHRTNLAAVLSRVEIRARSIVRVIETKSCRSRSKYDPAFAVGRNKGCALFRSSIHVNGHHLAVPMQLFWHICIVEYVHGDLLAFLEAKQRPRKLPVVGSRRDDPVGRDLDRRRLDVQRADRKSVV